ncbi:MAG TPA: extracellular solute-binding protein [Chloroflexota bacterium]|jgi:trehalose/maltose transport system substrate-binding protein|nr:extracellular solute-binding protein [Chloroflexota bacterium]
MNRRIAAIAASVIVFSMILPTAVGVAARTHGQTVRKAIPAAPKDPFAKLDKKYRGQTITYFGGSVGSDHDTDVALAASFTKSTGIHVNLDEMTSSSSATLATLQNLFNSHSGSIDVTRLDVVWPGIFGKYLVDIKQPLAADYPLESKGIIKNDTVGGHLVAMPYQGDFGLLYYRKDLLKKYHEKVPTTWTQLTAEAKKIQAGEKKTNKAFAGFVFQGNSYEGLTCNALEWIASYGGGGFITPGGKVTVNNAKAKAALTLAKSWVGTISPKGVTTYQEGDTHGQFLAGDAAFARNWPYMWSLQTGTKAQGKIGVAPLPSGPGGKSSATTGGWEIGINKYSSHKGAAEAWARYYASKPVEAWRAIYGGIAPTMPSVAAEKSVKKANPALAIASKTNNVVRPSTVLGGNYAQGSAYIYQTINSILTGNTSVSSGLSTLQAELKSLHP